MFKELMNVYNSLGDDISKKLFDIRMEYSITKDKKKLQDEVYSMNRYEFTDLFEFIESFPDGKKIIIYGAGDSGNYAYRILKDYGYGERVIAFGDDYIKKQGLVIEGIPVLSPVEVCENYKDAIILISASQYGMDIYKLLLRIGVKRENLYFPRYRRIMGMTGTQYFDLPYLKITNDAVYIDGGTYDGETCIDFIKWNGPNYKKIYAFEPSRYSIDLCNQRIEKNKIDRIEMINKGLYSSDAVLNFMHNAAGSKVSNDCVDTIEVTSIDKVLNGEKATFIKLDVEGCETEALKGAKDTIQKFHPTLAVCIYHKPEDIFEIPIYILSLVPEYKLYIRHYSNVESETILYAVVDENN